MYPKRVLLVVIAILIGWAVNGAVASAQFDLVQDGIIDVNDLKAFVERWLDESCLPGDCTANFDGQGSVDLKDFSLLARNWLDLGGVPNVVGEIAEPLAIEPANWWITGNAAVSSSVLTWQGHAVTQIDYHLQAGPAIIYYDLPAEHLAAERLRFWLKGDNSSNLLRISCYLSSDSNWLVQTAIPLDFDVWRHFEIPASNPIHRYYSTVTEFRFELIPNGSTSPHQLLLSHSELVAPELIKAPLPFKELPSPAFDTWGGPTQQQFIDSAPVGTTIHAAPIGFFGDLTVSERALYAMKAVKWANDVGQIPGIHFYNHPGDWIQEHLDMGVKNQEGVVQTDGGAFTSPWNPNARALWRQHILDCLQYMQDNHRLQYVQLVEISPGVEGEVSYEWSNVWAFDDYAIAAYRQYLRDFYDNDVAALNADWATAYTTFDTLMPPADYYPDRAHWVFTDFYRLGMLENHYFLASCVQEFFTPAYWLCMPHAITNYPMRFYSARYPLFYCENLNRLGILDYAHITALAWQHKEDVQYIRSLGVKVIGERDVAPTEQSMQETFDFAQAAGMDGVFVGVMEPLSSAGTLTPLGLLTQQLIQNYHGPDDPCDPPGPEFVFEDFENVTDWYVAAGGGSGGGSISTDASEAQVGNYAAALNYNHTSAVGFDYIDFGRNLSGYPMDMSAVTAIHFQWKAPYDLDSLVQLRLESATGGFLEYNFSEGDGQWREVTLAFPDDFVDYGSNPSLTNISYVKIRSHGDVSSLPTSGTCFIDQMIFITSE